MADALDAEYEMLRRALQTPEEARREAVLAKMTGHERIDEEACAIKYGIVQHMLRATRAVNTSDERVLEDYARQYYEPADVHGTCQDQRCRMQSFAAGERFWSLHHQVWLDATGDVYVCSTSGRAHVCDGLSCQYSVRLDHEGTVKCTITGRVAMHQLIVSSYDVSGRAAADDDDDDWFGVACFDRVAAGMDGADVETPTRAPRRRRRRAAGVARSINATAESERWRLLCDYIRTILYGFEYRDKLIQRCCQLWNTMRAQIIALARAQTATSAQILSTLQKTAAAALGSTTRCIVLHFGTRLEALLEARDQGALRHYLVGEWERTRPLALSPIEDYFAGAIFSFWRIMIRLPVNPWRRADAPAAAAAAAATATLPNTLSMTVLTLMQMLRDGLCYSVVYNGTSQAVVPCIRDLNNVSTTMGGSCACQKRMGYGAIDCPFVDSHLWSTDSQRIDQAMVASHGADNLRVRELWLLPAHPVLAGMPPDDMAPSLTDIESSFHKTNSFNCRGIIQAAVASLFDTRNPALDSMTIDSMEDFCLHRSYEIQRLIGAQD